MTVWNHMQIELKPQDMQVSTMLGPGEFTRSEAHAEVQKLLDRSAPLRPELAEAARQWQRGAKDDTVYSGTFIWTIYEHEDGRPHAGAMVWLEDFAATMRAAGVDAQLPKLPPDRP